MLFQIEVLFPAQPGLVLLDAVHAQQIGFDELADLVKSFMLISAGEMHISMVMWGAVLLKLDGATSSLT